MNFLVPILFLSSIFGGDTNKESQIRSFDDLKSTVVEIAAMPYKDHRRELPKWLKELTYDDLRKIRFNPKKAVWRSERLPFQLQFFHPGGNQIDQIKMHLIEKNGNEHVPFSQDLFEYEEGVIRGTLDGELSFSGFRLHYPLNRPDYLDELLVFQGATYYRALAEGLNYGISSRIIMIDPEKGEDEEFPSFTDFWVYMPEREATSIHLMGLFDSPSLAGAADFTVRPGISTYIDVKVFICSRKKSPIHYGIAPLKSMYWYGENSSWKWGDFRPEVHDSDGLLIHTSADQWIWRPLTNEGKMKKSFFVDDSPKGFGLLQRDRNFSSYRDLEAKYHMRPSVWIEPRDNWGQGYISLIEAPSTSEYNDNISAVWFPKQALEPGKSAEFSYRQIWFMDNKNLPPIGKVCSTYAYQPAGSPAELKKFIIEFYWPNVQADATSNTLDIHATAENAKIMNKHADYNFYENFYRVFFDAEVQDKSKPVELNVDICKEGKPITETWTYQWTP
ncbi:MAG: glucan biosynthesis protein G [Candidatus Nanoarchaeia archaeon]